MATSGIKLTKRKVGQMWKLFQEGWSLQAISRKCKVSHMTVRKYRDREGWDQRRAEIVRKANEKADKKQVSLLAENMKIVRFAKSKIVDQIKAIEQGKEVSKTPVGDLDKLIRLEEFLQGRPDSRPQHDFTSYTEEELTVELQTTIQELMKIPECRQELQRLLSSPAE